jgi:hypothetical protein
LSRTRCGLNSSVLDAINDVGPAIKGLAAGEMVPASQID